MRVMAASTSSVVTGRVWSARWKPVRRREILAHAVRLHDLRHAQLRRLVGGEALVADLAAAPPPDGIALLAYARVDDLRVLGAAEGAFHEATER
jgi:hypothetical protein